MGLGDFQCPTLLSTLRLGDGQQRCDLPLVQIHLLRTSSRMTTEWLSQVLSPWRRISWIFCPAFRRHYSKNDFIVAGFGLSRSPNSNTTTGAPKLLMVYGDLSLFLSVLLDIFFLFFQSLWPLSFLSTSPNLGRDDVILFKHYILADSAELESVFPAEAKILLAQCNSPTFLALNL